MKAALIALAVGMITATPAEAPAQKPRLVVFEAATRTRLAEEWDDDNRWQRERGYCLSIEVRPGKDYDTWRVTLIQRAMEPVATPTSVLPVCPDSTQAILHTHPPGACEDEMIGNKCTIGPETEYGYLCQPSPNDRAFLRRSRRKVDIVQCGPNQYVPYFRDGEGFY